MQGADGRGQEDVVPVHPAVPLQLGGVEGTAGNTFYSLCCQSASLACYNCRRRLRWVSKCEPKSAQGWVFDSPFAIIIECICSGDRTIAPTHLIKSNTASSGEALLYDFHYTRRWPAGVLTPPWQTPPYQSIGCAISTWPASACSLERTKRAWAACRCVKPPLPPHLPTILDP